MKSAAAIGICLVLFLTILFTVKVEVGPSPDTRLILEHTYQTFISPPCYEQSQKTNNLTESDLKTAKLNNYQPESSCTENSLEPFSQAIVYVLAEKFGVKKNKWEW
ncbi:hypothetical protein ACWKW1_23055 [Brevibacillus parabrevis]